MLTSNVATLHDNSAHGEDSYLVRDLGDNGLLDAVMDGVTGRSGGEASQILADALATVALTSSDDVVAVLEDVNQKFYRRGWGRVLLTTVSAALCLDDKLYVVGAGDSPVLLIRSDAFQQLSGHTSGFVHPGITRAIGAREKLAKLYRAEVTLEPDDRLVLATDGVTDNITSGELTDVVRHAASPDEAVERINTIIRTRHEEGRLPVQLGGRFRRDDRTVLVRFFSATG